jgi:aminotransferase
MAHGRPIAIPTRPEDAFALRASAVRERLSERSRILVLNFPTNPTGAVEPPEELKEIARIACERDLIVVTDEIYSELLYGPDRRHLCIASLPGMRERTVLLHGFSKAFAMTGFRLGFACAPAELTDAMMKIHQYSMLCAPITSQVAAREALQHGAAAAEEMRRTYEQRRELILGRFAQMGIPCFPPGGAFYAFPDIRSTGLTSREFAVRLLEEENVAVVPGDAFGPGGEGFLRCCYATATAQLRTALDRIARFRSRL